MTPNARFWTFENGEFVKITLKPDQRLTHIVGGRTDEGFSYTATTWEHTGDTVECQVSDWGQDCDGRHGANADYHCPLHLLQTYDRQTENGTIRVPHWISGDCSQYDQFAELAGY